MFSTEENQAKLSTAIGKEDKYLAAYEESYHA